MTEVFGTPYYLAPEVIKGLYNRQCDVWAVGVILHTMLIGIVPYDHKDTTKLLEMISESTHISLEHKKWRMRSVGSIDLVKKLLEVNPAVRIPAEVAMEHSWLQKMGHFTVEKEEIRDCLNVFKRYRTIGPL